MFQRIIGVDVIETSRVDEAEQEVAKLCRLLLRVVLLPQFCLQFAKLFAHLVPDVLLLLPVETDGSGFVLNTIGLDERRQRLGNAAEHRLVAVLFLLLNLLPRVDDVARSLRYSVAIDVGVAEDELVAELVANVGDVELTLLAPDFRVEDDVQQHVAQLLFDVRNVVRKQGIAQLKRFFYRVGTQAFVRLLVVPRALLP